MLVFGIDVLILACFGCMLVFGSYVAACLVPLGRDEGVISIISTAVTATMMVIAYVVMAHVLDAVFGAFGW